MGRPTCQNEGLTVKHDAVSQESSIDSMRDFFLVRLRQLTLNKDPRIYRTLCTISETDSGPKAVSSPLRFPEAALLKHSYLKSSNADYIDQVFQRYLENPDSVDESWRYFFEGIEFGYEIAPPVQEPLENGQETSAAVSAGASTDGAAELRVAELILAYRERGHLLAKTNPLKDPPSSLPELELTRYGLSAADLQRTFSAGRLVGLGSAKLADILSVLQQTYCGSIGTEIMHIQNVEARTWLLQRLEGTRNRDKLDSETQKHILKRLTEVEVFERFLHTRYVAAKRFSVEGGDAVMPALDSMIEHGANHGVEEFVIGMAHRGRLNVLHNLFGKKAEAMFTEFEANYKVDYSHGEGDVKYHKGYSTDLTLRTGKRVHLSLGNNPSHLEFINPVIEGMARAKQAMRGDEDRSKVVPILIHGDAAFAGQGVCYETLNLSQLHGYRTGGTMHVVINNQVGFTTSPEEGRSTTYCTDLAKMLDSPILHVNGDDAEAVTWASRVLLEFRQKFKADAFLDIVCYRKYGHNEGDEPSFTQPLLYKKIKTHPSPREVYAAKLVAGQVVTETEAQEIIDRLTAIYMAAQASAKAEAQYEHASTYQSAWKGYRDPKPEDHFLPVSTTVEEARLKDIAEKINTIPKEFHLHPKLQRFFDERLKVVREGTSIDWGTGEALAYASLVAEGHPVRLSGQDAGRGTFTHRQSLLSDFESGERFAPINAVSDGKARYEAWNSHLSETGVMAFEYGYSITDPRALVLWEAQFGDFANGAQVMIDQFIATGESKWQRSNGLVLLLPHGYEGQGPEHSSARLERFLQLSGKFNQIVANYTTPANFFHALRRQVKRDFRRPLVIMTPKSLLRHKDAVSTLADFTQIGYQECIDDPRMQDAATAQKVKRVLLCSGKVYYDLSAERETRKREDIALVRVEQLYPWPGQRLAQILNRYAGAKDLVWVQEEPRNMGAWSFVFNIWMGGFELFQNQVQGRGIRYVGREVCSSPAVGSIKLHQLEQKALLDQAFGE